MKTVSLFSGCGGFDLGAQRAGAEIVYANEISKDARASLRRYFPEAQVDERDVREIRAFPAAQLLVGGYPCQSFSLGGNREPSRDPRTFLYQEFARCLDQVRPEFFIAENVKGLKSLRGGMFLDEQVKAFERAGERGYRVTAQLLDAKDYGVPQTRKRMFLVGVRRDLDRVFLMPEPTHGIKSRRSPHLLPFTSHGEAIRDLPAWPKGEFYERPHDPEGHFSWYYMSRNRKAKWDGPSFSVVANWRHVTIHPASPGMTLTWSNLADGWKQRWDFSSTYEHLAADPNRLALKEPRRLSWRECARIQTFPPDFNPVGDTESKFEQIGNAVPPLFSEMIVRHLVGGKGLMEAARAEARLRESSTEQLTFW